MMLSARNKSAPIMHKAYMDKRRLCCDLVRSVQNGVQGTHCLSKTNMVVILGQHFQPETAKILM